MGILTLLAGPLGRIIMYGLGALLLAGSLLTAYLSWKHSVEARVLAEFNRKQMEQVIKDQERFIADAKALRETADEIRTRVDRSDAELAKKLKEVDDFLSKPETVKQDRPASPLLRETIRRLGGR